MLDFIFGPDGIGSERINLLWLGMNKNFFQHLQKQEEQALNILQISEICDKIWNSVKDKRLHLSTVSNLLKGTCMVHKAQVDYLYNETKNLFCNQQYKLEISFTTDNIKVTGQSRKSSIFVESLDDLIEESKNEKFDDIKSFLNKNYHILNTCKEKDITLNEFPENGCGLYTSDNIEEELQDFDELTNNEKEDFLSIINLQKKNRKRKSSNSNYLYNFSVEDNYNLDIPRNENITEIFSNNNTNNPFTHLLEVNNLDKNNNIESDLSGKFDNFLNSTNRENQLRVELPEPPILFKNNVIPPNYNAFERDLANKRNNERPTIKRRKIGLHIDKMKEFTIDQITSQVYNTSVFRCFNPLQDVVPKRSFKLKSSDYLMNSPCIRLCSPLVNLFKKNLKRKKQYTDSSILKCILNKENHDDSNVMIKKRQKRRDTSSKNISSFHTQLHEVEMIASINSENVQNTSGHRSTTGHLRKDQLFITDLIESYMINENFDAQDQECSTIFKKLKKNWSPLSVLQKLSRLGITNGKTVSMQVLCKNVSKIEAAIAFSSIIQLSAKNYVKILKEQNSNIVAGIQISDKIPFRSFNG